MRSHFNLDVCLTDYLSSIFLTFINILMKFTNTGIIAALFLFSIFLTERATAQNKSIALSSINPHYFTYKGKPSLLITSAEHYGSVLNLDFDYAKYLNELSAKGLNLTRVFTGAYVEPAGSFSISANTLAPAANRFICPWKRSTITGYQLGGNKFDLSQWDEAYFSRLKDFLSQAKKRGIIVELTFFCPFYEDSQWKISPMNHINNINNLGTMDRESVYTLKPTNNLLPVQTALVKKIISELRDYPNLIYEICNEPYFGGVTLEWQHQVASVIKDAEKGFNNPHLISQNIANNSKKIENPNPAVSVFNFHYAIPAAVKENYALDKVIGDNETGFQGTADEAYRTQAWLFIMAGGGLYNNLDYSFATGKEDGSYSYPSSQPGGGNAELRRQLGYLKRFVESFKFIHMHPDLSFVKEKSSAETQIQGLAEPGKQYGLYLYGKEKKEIELDLPVGTYHQAWLNTLTGVLKKDAPFKHNGGRIQLKVPTYTKEIALRIIRKN